MNALAGSSAVIAWKNTLKLSLIFVVIVCGIEQSRASPHFALASCSQGTDTSMKTLRANAFLAVVALVLVCELILETLRAIRGILHGSAPPTRVRRL
jgi:hypothetical protein